jgi:hypothetical protein
VPYDILSSGSSDLYHFSPGEQIRFDKKACRLPNSPPVGCNITQKTHPLAVISGKILYRARPIVDMPGSKLLSLRVGNRKNHRATARRQRLFLLTSRQQECVARQHLGVQISAVVARTASFFLGYIPSRFITVGRFSCKRSYHGNIPWFSLITFHGKAIVKNVALSFLQLLTK